MIPVMSFFFCKFQCDMAENFCTFSFNFICKCRLIFLDIFQTPKKGCWRYHYFLSTTDPSVFLYDLTKAN